MAKTVFILGAGASKQAGAPLMMEFLDAADDLRNRDKLPEMKADFELVFKGISALRPAYANANVDMSNNIESVFAAFEMARLLGRLGELPEKEIDRLPKAMRRVIEQTLEHTIRFPVKGKIFHAPEPYEEFAKLLIDLRTPQRGTPHSCSVITFNYDLCLDFALGSKTDINYCLSNSNGNFKYLKLHGSLNWAKCPSCQEIGAWTIEEFMQGRRYNIWPETKYTILNIASQIDNYKHCGASHCEEPFVVPPTWNKTEYHSQLRNVWKAAVQELSEAENIIVCGYSLPPTDQFFRFLYALGTVGEVRLKRFCVFDPDPQIAERFRALLGPVVQARFLFEKTSFEMAIPRIRGMLQAG